jgi:mRNA-degrading endonuclease RelE of RelBE toxin-antitoxin system
LPVSPRERTAITEQTTPGFRHDLDRLSPDDRARVLETLRRSYGLLRDNPRSFFAKAQRPLPIHLKGGLSSSLYSLRVGRDIRLIMAVDDDPVFGQTLVTLFRVVRHGEVDRSYRSIAHLLYRNRIERNGRAL